MPKVEWMHLCDYAVFDQTQKPCLIGIFKAITVQRVPAQHTRVALAFEIVGQKHEKVSVRIQVMRPDRDALVDINNPSVDLGEAGQHDAIIGLDNLVLPDVGPYEVRIYLNDELSETLTLQVLRQKKTPAHE